MQQIRCLVSGVLLCALVQGCVDDNKPMSRAAIRSTRSPLKPVPLAACGSVTYEGCCDNETIWYCDNGQLAALQCQTPYPSCGWDATNLFYDCGHGGAADPSGTNPISCAGFFGDGGAPGLDSGVPDQGPVADGGGPGCVVSTSPGCGGCACEACVCQMDAYCCSNQWDSICVGECIQCGGCGPGSDGGPKLDYGPAADQGPVGDGGGPGCVVSVSPGCGGCACEACVCQMDSYCCITEWDSICVDECVQQCGGCGAGSDGGPKLDYGPAADQGPVGDGGGPGCVVSASPGCGGCACEACVCQMDSYCCITEWDSICVDECVQQCGGCGPGSDGGTVKDQGPVMDQTPVSDVPAYDQAQSVDQSAFDQSTADGRSFDGMPDQMPAGDGTGLADGTSGDGGKKKSSGGCACGVSGVQSPDLTLFGLLGLLLVLRRR